MRLRFLAVALTLLVSLPSTAAEVGGVQLAERINASGHTLSLQGAGIRSKFFVKVYVAALYLANPSGDPAAILRDGSPRQVQMIMLRDLGRDKIVEAVVDGFRKSAGNRMPALQERLDRFVASIPDLEEGQSLTVTWDPASGTTLRTSTGRTMTVEGRDFADALFSVWLGSDPVDQKLKAAMLGAR